MLFSSTYRLPSWRFVTRPRSGSRRAGRPPYAGRVHQTTVEGVRIAWARTDHDSRRKTADALIRALAAELVPGSDLRIERRCPVCGGPHGRPALAHAPVLASVAYADPWTVVAVAPADHVDAIGIDAEPAGASLDLAALFAPSEPPDLRGWTAIEAVLKADGRGLLLSPDQVHLFANGRATVPGGGEFRILPVATVPGLIVTLTLRRPDPGPRPIHRP